MFERSNPIQRPMFKDRADAGRQLAARLRNVEHHDAIVIALPRGGLPVAAEIAKALALPLDILLIRKVGVPQQPELALGAVSDGEKMVLTLNRDVMLMLGMQETDVELLARRELPELERRRQRYMAGKPSMSVAGKTVIVVDDGLATGATAHAALRLLRQRGARKVILAIPVAPRDAIPEFELEADEVICLHTPVPFHAVGAHYTDFRQVHDEEAIAILEHARIENEAGKTNNPATTQ